MSNSGVGPVLAVCGADSGSFVALLAPRVARLKSQRTLCQAHLSVAGLGHVTSRIQGERGVLPAS